MKILLSLAACGLLIVAAATNVSASHHDMGAQSGPELMCGSYFGSSTDAAKAVISEDVTEAKMARVFLRRQGVEGLKALREVYAGEIKNHLNSPLAPEIVDAALWAKISTALDEVSQQHNAWSQGAPLFWHTDIEAAKFAAERDSKPILSLRLLGKLTDECSCANSRFFRTAFYANVEVATFMSSNFTLLWTSERPVPKVTIDMGDGRVMTCTITGNSAHYLLDAKGRPLDCIPGLYGPVAFTNLLDRGTKLNAELAGKDDTEFARLLKLHHRARLATVNAALQDDLAAAGISTVEIGETERVSGDDAEFLRRSGAIPAEVASRRAMAKEAVERNFFVLLGRIDRSKLEGKLSAEIWQKLAALHAAECKLDEGSIKLMREQNPESAAEASTRAMSKMKIEAPIFRLVRKFENSIALDTVKNEYLFHARIHEWLASGDVGGFEKFNERIYAELFATPANDPWLGLKGDDYTGLKNDGVNK